MVPEHQKIDYVELGSLVDKHIRYARGCLNNALLGCRLRQDCDTISLDFCIGLLDSAIMEYKKSY